jgi:Uma2 family endonuclease
MTQTPVKLSFEEYLNYDDGTENRYELVDGELLKMPPPTGDHEDIVDFLYISFYLEIQRLVLDWAVKQGRTGIRTTPKRSRVPDICVITKEQRQSMKGKPAVLQSPPLLTVEVVSPESVKRDYEQKPAEYATIRIPEYWIVDPLSNKVSVLMLVNGRYETTEFTGRQRIISQTFPELALTAEQVLSA